METNRLILRRYDMTDFQDLLEHAFEQGIHRVYAECDPLNTASWKLLERLGFHREAFFRQNVIFWKDEDGLPIWKDTYVYAKLKEERK